MKTKKEYPITIHEAVHVLMTCPLNRNDMSPESKASFLICGATEKVLSTEMRAARQRLDEEAFNHYYGMKSARAVILAEMLESHENQKETISEILAVAQLLGARKYLHENFRKLEKAGLGGEISEFHSGFRGLVTEVHSLRMSDKTYKIIETLDDGKPKFYVAGQHSICYSKMESALFCAMFGQRIYPAIELMYEKLNA